MIYVAMWNLPGCLPEMEPFRTLDESAAREFLADGIKSSAEHQFALDSEAFAVSHYARQVRQGDLDSVLLADGYVYTIEQSEPVDDEEARRVAVATVVECALDEVEGGRLQDGLFDAAGEEWLCLTDDEADELWDSALDDYIDECITPELPEAMRFYFDSDAWKRDEKINNGRGQSLSGYDGDEHEHGDFFLYRVN